MSVRAPLASEERARCARFKSAISSAPVRLLAGAWAGVWAAGGSAEAEYSAETSPFVSLTARGAKTGLEAEGSLTNCLRGPRAGEAVSGAITEGADSDAERAGARVGGCSRTFAVTTLGDGTGAFGAGAVVKCQPTTSAPRTAPAPTTLSRTPAPAPDTEAARGTGPGAGIDSGAPPTASGEPDPSISASTPDKSRESSCSLGPSFTARRSRFWITSGEAGSESSRVTWDSGKSRRRGVPR